MTDKISADAYFAIIPEWVLDADVSPQAIRLFCVLNRYANTQGIATPSRQTIAKRMRVSTDTVDRAAKELEGIGAVTVEPQFADDGDQSSNAWKLHILRPPRRKGAATPRRKGAAQNKERDETEKESSTNSLAPGRKRDEIWDAFVHTLGFDTDDITTFGRSGLNRCVKELRAVGATPDEIHKRASRYHSLFPNATLTPFALVKHWPLLSGAGGAGAGQPIDTSHPEPECEHGVRGLCRECRQAILKRVKADA